MTLTDAAIGAATLWLLYILCGLPGQRGGSAAGVAESTALFAVAPGTRLVPAPYSVWHEETPLSRHVTPPPPGDAATAADIAYNPLGSAPVRAIGLPQMLSLTEVAIAPGGELALANLGGSGVIVLQSGWLELAEQEGDARLTRSPLAESPAPREDAGPPTLTAGDRLTFGPGATIVLRNRGEHSAQLLTAFVLARPGFPA